MFTSIAIIGRPNVGKSSLFNKLTKSRDAVVSDFPGLTKDRNYGFIKLKNRDTLLVDTGGIANKKETIKEAISQQAWLAVEESSLIILLLDSSEDLNKEDLDIIYKLRKLNKDFITVINKIDKKSNSSIYDDLAKNGILEFIKISAEHSKNLNILKSHLESKVPNVSVELPEGKKVAILGRPNAGKSTFINQIINEDRLIVSDIAGTTIDAISVPFEFNNHKFIFIDTAGIRKGYKYNHKIEYFSYVRAIHAIEQSDIVIFICDATEGLVDQDLKILNMIIDNGKPVLFVFNKIDLLKKEELIEIYKTKKMQSEFMSNLVTLEISAIKKLGFNKVFNMTNKLIDLSQKKFSTSNLNNLLRKFISMSAPPAVGGRQLKFKHVHFGGTCPTTLIIHSNQDKKIPNNYKKYLENSFRSSLGLLSIQLRLIFRKADNPYDNKTNKLTERQIKKRQRLIKHNKKVKK
jgi:GTP-binding protein|tara:strand:+ start:4756 stop:6141 length:1386 start_codon:yes stop_codon:yes gene_type:complete